MSNKTNKTNLPKLADLKDNADKNKLPKLAESEKMIIPETPEETTKITLPELKAGIDLTNKYLSGLVTMLENLDVKVERFEDKLDYVSTQVKGLEDYVGNVGTNIRKELNTVNERATEIKNIIEKARDVVSDTKPKTIYKLKEIVRDAKGVTEDVVQETGPIDLTTLQLRKPKKVKKVNLGILSKKETPELLDSKDIESKVIKPEVKETPEPTLSKVIEPEPEDIEPEDKFQFNLSSLGLKR